MVERQAPWRDGEDISSAGGEPGDVGRHVRALTPRLVALRRDLHQHPELAFEEVRTAAVLAERMRAVGLAVEERIGGTGVLAVLDGATPGRTLLVRADMDALRMEEATGREYASRRVGHAHACGHDAHSAIVAGVAEVLARHRHRIAGRIAFVFQPADEPMRGAQRMIEDGLLGRVEPDMSLSVHVLPMIAVGQVVIQRGPIWASWDTRVLTIHGPAPSVAAPSTSDIARVAAGLTTALYELVEREEGSPEPVTFRIRSLEAEQGGGGDPAPAAIEVHLGRGEPGRARIEINLALYDNRLRARLLARIEQVAATVATACGGTVGWEVDYALPALVNDERVTGALDRAAERVVGRANVVTGWRERFSDDFGLFMAAAPGSLLLLGTANPDRGITEIWHRPGFDIDEAALPIGVHIMALAALDLMR